MGTQAMSRISSAVVILVSGRLPVADRTRQTAVAAVVGVLAPLATQSSFSAILRSLSSSHRRQERFTAATARTRF